MTLLCGRFRLDQSTHMLSDVQGEIPDFPAENLDEVASEILKKAFDRLAGVLAPKLESAQPKGKT